MTRCGEWRSIGLSAIRHCSLDRNLRIERDDLPAPEVNHEPSIAGGECPCPAGQAREEALTFVLLELAGDESVRVVEALAAALVNDLHLRPDDALESWSRPAAPARGLCEDDQWAPGFERRLGVCRRVARRALRGSLADPTEGANAFHRIEASPPWARELLPIAMYGPYLFYRR